MTTDDLPGMIRRAAGAAAGTPDVDRIASRAERRRRARRVGSVVVAVVAVLGVAGVAATIVPERTTVRFAEQPDAGGGPTPSTTTSGAPSAQASAAPAAPAGATGSQLPVVGPPCPSTPPSNVEINGADGRPAVGTVVDGWPARVEGEPVVAADRFVVVTGPAPNAVWSSADGRRWRLEAGTGLQADLIFDAGTSTVGEAVVLDADGRLWSSADAGTTWRCDAVGVDAVQAMAVGGTDAWWLIAGSRDERHAAVWAVPRDGSGPAEVVAGDFAHGTLPPRATSLMVAAGPAGTVVVADGSPQPTVWRIADDLTATRVDGAFGGARVSAVSATADGFVATVRPTADGAPQLWRSTDGVRWSRGAAELPVPTCATIVRAGGATLAAGSPCDEDAGWQVWTRGGGDGWTRIGSDTDAR